MLNAVIWLSPFLYLLLPAAAAFGLRLRYREMVRAARIGLVQPLALRRFRWAILLCGGFLILIFATPFLDISRRLPVLSGLPIIGIMLLLRAARRGLACIQA